MVRPELRVSVDVGCHRHSVAVGLSTRELLEEFEDYLRCGRLEQGFLRVRCDTRHAEHLVAFSCKRPDRRGPDWSVAQGKALITRGCSYGMFASRPGVMGRVLGIVYRVIVGHLIKEAGFTRQRARTGAVTLIRHFGSALNVNIHFHMLFLESFYVKGSNGPGCFVRQGREGLDKRLYSYAKPFWLGQLEAIPHRSVPSLHKDSVGPNYSAIGHRELWPQVRARTEAVLRNAPICPS